MARNISYSPELCERAVMLVIEHRSEYPSEWATMTATAGMLDMTPKGCDLGLFRPRQGGGNRFSDQSSYGNVQLETVIDNTLVAVCWMGCLALVLVSITRTVKVKVPVIVALPEITPVGFRFSPAGTVPEMRDHL